MIINPPLILSLGRYKAGRFYHMLNLNANQAGTIDHLNLSPFYIHHDWTFDQIGFWLQTAGTAGAVMRLGIYKDNGDGYPGSLVLDAGTVATDAGGGTFKTITISQLLTKGLYWVGGAQQVAACTTTKGTWPAALGALSPIGNLVAPTSGSINVIYGFRETGVSGALPATFTSVETDAGNDTSKIWLRAA